MMVRFAIRTAAVAAVLSVAPLASATVYTDAGSFLANVQAGYYLNAFNDAVPGPSAPLNYGPVGGFAYTVDAIVPANGGLYNDVGLISTNNAEDLIRVTFTGAPVTAIGGNFWSTDIAVQPLTALVTISLSNGDVESFVSSAATDFRGFTTNVAISSITIDAADDVQNNVFVWSTMDNLIVGAAVPAPACAAPLALMAVVARRRRP